MALHCSETTPKYILISLHSNCESAFNWKISTWETQNYSSEIINIMTIDALMAQGDRTSAGMMFSPSSPVIVWSSHKKV